MRSRTGGGETVDELERLPRCCDSHPDLATLCRHLIDQYPDVAPTRVAQEVRAGKSAVELVGLDRDVLVMVELTARARLELVSGRREEIARINPQPHPNRVGARSSGDGGG